MPGRALLDSNAAFQILPALRYDLTLITSDHHFDHLKGLRIEAW